MTRNEARAIIVAVLKGKDVYLDGDYAADGILSWVGCGDCGWKGGATVNAIVDALEKAGAFHADAKLWEKRGFQPHDDHFDECPGAPDCVHASTAKKGLIRVCAKCGQEIPTAARICLNCAAEKGAR